MPDPTERVVFTLQESELPTARTAASRGLCDHCLGRLFAARGHGYSNRERGALMREAIGLGQEVAPQSCSLCLGLFARLEFFVTIAREKAAPWGHATYLVGTKVDHELERSEESLWSELSVAGESIRKELNREIGKRYGDATGTQADLKAPDIAILVDTRFDFAEVSPNPLHLYGRYRKLSREIPQTRWPCKQCQGRGTGCPKCGGSGKMYQTSVEELVGGAALAASGGEEHSFHAMGREDIDARMLGRGRPFVIEITKPRRRTLDLEALQATVNADPGGRIEVSGLRRSTAAEVEEVSTNHPEKSYQAGVRCDSGLEGIEEALRALTLVELAQRTPVRVSHRRADMVRKKAVVSAELVSVSADSREAVINIRASAGAYIKELVHGDQGRTSPSIAGLLARPVEVVWLDVLELHDQE
ncbi:MAG TPA: tRNA pseudouridine(54/55) synthase Pus10 [Thermoplasmata archaeon]|nr:tRNA pseudouridine(54/55) synthase Pus10 [Thermoplasmata archaeon]